MIKQYLFLLPFISSTLFGISATWNVDAGGNWSTAGNWDNGVPNGALETATFGGVITAARTVAVDIPIVIDTIRFTGATSSYLISGGGGSLSGVDLISHTSTATATQEISSDISSPGIFLDANVASGRMLTLSGQVSANILRTSAGTLRLSGSGANSISLLSPIDGVVELAKDAGVLAVQAIDTGFSAVINCINNNQFDNLAGTVSISTGTFDLKGATQTLSSFTISGATSTYTDGGGTLNVADLLRLSASGGVTGQVNLVNASAIEVGGDVGGGTAENIDLGSGQRNFVSQAINPGSIEVTGVISGAAGGNVQVATSTLHNFCNQLPRDPAPREIYFIGRVKIPIPSKYIPLGFGSL